MSSTWRGLAEQLLLVGAVTSMFGIIFILAAIIYLVVKLCCYKMSILDYEISVTSSMVMSRSGKLLLRFQFLALIFFLCSCISYFFLKTNLVYSASSNFAVSNVCVVSWMLEYFGYEFAKVFLFMLQVYRIYSSFDNSVYPLTATQVKQIFFMFLPGLAFAYFVVAILALVLPKQLDSIQIGSPTAYTTFYCSYTEINGLLVFALFVSFGRDLATNGFILYSLISRLHQMNVYATEHPSSPALSPPASSLPGPARDLKTQISNNSTAADADADAGVDADGHGRGQRAIAMKTPTRNESHSRKSSKRKTTTKSKRSQKKSSTTAKKRNTTSITNNHKTSLKTKRKRTKKKKSSTANTKKRRNKISGMSRTSSPRNSRPNSTKAGTTTTTKRRKTTKKKKSTTKHSQKRSAQIHGSQNQNGKSSNKANAKHKEPTRISVVDASHESRYNMQNRRALIIKYVYLCTVMSVSSFVSVCLLCMSLRWPTFYVSIDILISTVCSVLMLWMVSSFWIFFVDRIFYSLCCCKCCCPVINDHIEKQKPPENIDSQNEHEHEHEHEAEVEEAEDNDGNQENEHEHENENDETEVNDMDGDGSMAHDSEIDEDYKHDDDEDGDDSVVVHGTMDGAITDYTDRESFSSEYEEEREDEDEDEDSDDGKQNNNNLDELRHAISVEIEASQKADNQATRVSFSEDDENESVSA